MNYNDREKLFGDLKSQVDDLLIEGSFYGKTFVVPFNKKVTKADREEIINMFNANYNYFESITSTTNELTLQCGEFNPEEVIPFIENAPRFNETLYPSNHIFDKDKTVRWNEEEVCRLNEEIKERKAKQVKLNQILDNMFKESLIKDCIYMNEVFKNIPLEAFDAVFNKAYSDGHAYGYHEVKSYFIDEMDMLEDFLKKANL